MSIYTSAKKCKKSEKGVTEIWIVCKIHEKGRLLQKEL